MTTVAIVPMRHSSERVPGKNYRQLVDRPLYAHVLDALLACPEVDEICVDTDSDTIRAGVAARYDSVRVIERPERLRGGHVSMNDVLRYDLTLTGADLILQTHATNPFLRAATLSGALQAFGEGRADHDSLFSVTAVRKRFWSEDGEPLNHDQRELRRTQDLPPLYEENSCIYVFPRETMERLGRRIGDTPLLYPIDPLEAWDIDDATDWEIAESLASRLRVQR